MGKQGRLQFYVLKRDLPDIDSGCTVAIDGDGFMLDCEGNVLYTPEQIGYMRSGRHTFNDWFAPIDFDLIKNMEKLEERYYPWVV